MEPAKPSLELLRSLTDEHVLRALMQHKRLTRAELATETGISKPTAGESVRRLAEAGLVVDTGQRTPGGRGRGRVGSYYALADDIGTALAISIAPEGVVAEHIDVHGTTLSRADIPISKPARPKQVADALRKAVHGLSSRLAVVSAADPVDRATGQLIHLPDAPFLVGELDTVKVLAPCVAGPITVDNDVNWAAQAERAAQPVPLNDFAYVFLDAGMGCAIVSDGSVRRGHTGLAGEIAHLITTGPHGQAIRLIELFDELGLRQPSSTAIDAPSLLSTTTTHSVLGNAISGVLAAILALTDPETIIIGGSWGTHPLILDAITAAFTRHPRHVPIRAAQLTVEPSLTGARADALSRLRSAIIATPRI